MQWERFWSLKKRADTGAMTILIPCGGGRISNDAAPVQSIFLKPQGFDIAHVLDVKSSGVDCDQPEFVFFFQKKIITDRLERALSQAAKDDRSMRKLDEAR